jgi:hypothetical protein
MFSNIQVNRYAKDQITVVRNIIVPIMFAPVEKHHQARTEQYSAEPEDENHKRFYLMIPRVALNFTGIQYDPERAVGVNEYRYWQDTSQDGQILNSMFVDYTPSPYNFQFQLSIRADHISDFAQIIEQILAYFNPKLYLRVKEFSFLNIERQLPVILNDVAPDWTNELDTNGQRMINGTINFTIEGWVYRPISTAKMVKVIKTKFYVGNDTVNHEISMSASRANSAGQPEEIPDHFQVSAYDEQQSAYFYLSANEILTQ